jgi:hypothetical protein
LNVKLVVHHVTGRLYKVNQKSNNLRGFLDALAKFRKGTISFVILSGATGFPYSKAGPTVELTQWTLTVLDPEMER